MSSSLADCKIKISNEASGGEFFVLFLDDEPLLGSIFTKLVSEFGLKCFATTDPKLALDFVRREGEKIVLVVSDFAMPEMDGFQFRRAIEGVQAALPFAILSGHVNREMALQAVELKIAAFLDKPVDLQKLADLLIKEALPRLVTLKEDAELLQGFILETEELLIQAQDLLIRLSEDLSDTAALNSFFGTVHTVKGASSFFEQKNLHRFAHRFEDILKKLQHGELAVTEARVLSLYQGLDQLNLLLSEFKTRKFSEPDVDALIAAILDAGREDKLNSATPAEPGQTASLEKTAQPKNAEVRVPLAELDEFMQLSGEMTVIRNMLNKSLRVVEQQYAGDKDVANLVELLDELHKINALVQAKVTELRKVPIKLSFKPLSRAVKDVSRALHKEVDLVVEGSELKVDTTIAEVLSNSLLHIVKNSVDHGLESEEERKSSGKPKRGTIEISTRVENDTVFVQLKDDGKGINAKAIRSKAVSSGFRSAGELDQMSDEEIYPFIFESGFSTAKVVTEVSGRGVGMSMVKDSVEAVGGRILIASQAGSGTCFTLELPIPKSVLITNCLFVSENEETFGILEDDIVRVLQFGDDQKSSVLREVSGQPLLSLDEELIPVVRLSQVLGLAAEAESDTLNFVILGSEDLGQRLALQVGAIHDLEDTVVKSLIAHVNPKKIFQGATFLNDGAVGLILNASGIFQSIKMTVGRPKVHKGPALVEAVPTEQLILLSLAQPGCYALPQEAVLRIEEMDASAVVNSGDQLVLPYRNQALTLISLDKLLFNHPLPPLEGSLQILVIENKEKRIGLWVKKILDLAEVSEFLESDVMPGSFIRGHANVDDRMVTLIDLEQVLSA